MKRIGRRVLHVLAAAVISTAAFSAGSAQAADWPTARGNSQRTGNIDGQAGPKTPAVVWVYENDEDYVASPALDGERLYIPGLGAFNTSSLHALDMAPKAEPRALWTKQTPFLKLPVVCSPALAEGKIVFGDGMHQTDGATLYCLDAASGRPLWQLPEPGDLVHLEGTPTIAGGRVYIGGGAAGVLCVDLNQLTLDGQDVTLEQVQQQIDMKWKEMMAAYEAEKKIDPDFAIPPSEDELPQAAPRLLWQVGKDELHVDSPLAVAGDRVLAASAYLDLEKVGDRALHALDAKTGQAEWRVPLAHNPWAGPTISGDVVVVGCSSIRFDPKEIPQAKGEVVALNLSDGKVLWRKDVPGGIVSAVAVVDGTAIFTATDGKVRAWNLADGAQKWAYDAKAPFFAAPAVGGQTVYAADLKGIVHAIAADSGKQLWTLDVNKAVDGEGMVYGSPVLHGGRLYLGTCNLEGAAQQRTVVVCIGG